MIQQKVLIDTDILSAIMRQNPLAIVKAMDYLNQHNKFTFSLITRYEILRGLKAKAASKQLIAFETFCTNNIIVPVTDEIIVKAADIYAHLRRQGTPIGDADILGSSVCVMQWTGVVRDGTLI